MALRPIRRLPASCSSGISSSIASVTVPSQAALSLVVPFIHRKFDTLRIVSEEVPRTERRRPATRTTYRRNVSFYRDPVRLKSLEANGESCNRDGICGFLSIFTKTVQTRQRQPPIRCENHSMWCRLGQNPEIANLNRTSGD